MRQKLVGKLQGLRRDQQTVTTAVQEIDQKFGDRLAEIQASVDYNILDLSGSPAPWPDVLAVYAVKTTSNPDNGQEVVAMDNARKVLLRRGFWEMNRISSSVTVRTYEVSSTTTDENGNSWTFCFHRRTAVCGMHCSKEPVLSQVGECCRSALLELVRF